MKVNYSYRDSSSLNCYYFQNDKTFKGFYNNKAIKKGLEFAADNGALFAASTTFALSVTTRPISILLTPKTDKENKKIACAKSLSSSGVNFLMTFGLSLPLMFAMKKIDNNPGKYLKSESIKAYDKKSFEFATQMFKLGLGLAIAVPKAILTAAGLPYIMQSIFPDKKKEGLSFKGREKLAEKIGKVLDKKSFREFSNKHKNSNFPMHIFSAADVLTTGTFIHQISKSKKVKDERKKVLMFNAGISTALSIASGYILDRATDKPTQRFVEKFMEANKGLPNLDKQVEGIKIVKPVFLLAGVYYTLIPLISTYLADKAKR